MTGRFSVIPEILIPKNEDMKEEDEKDEKDDEYDDDKIVGSLNYSDDDEDENANSMMSCNHVMFSHTCDPEDFGHALDYLSLCMDPDDAKDYVKDLIKDANKDKIEHYKVVDIFRAAKCLPADPKVDGQAKMHMDLMNKGTKQSPVMLVRGEKSKTGAHPLIADGYHRLSAAYAIDTEMLIPCIVADK